MQTIKTDNSNGLIPNTMINLIYMRCRSILDSVSSRNS